MRAAIYSARPFEIPRLTRFAEAKGHELVFLEAGLNEHTAALAEGFEVISPFVNDAVDASIVAKVAELSVKCFILRSTGFNNIDLDAADEHGICVARVPAYSPEAVAEHTVALILTLNRKTHRAHARVREGNFSLEGLLGFNLHQRTIGVVGTGRIGLALCRILKGFGANVIASDPYPSDEARELGVRYVSMEDLIAQSRIISLNLPLTPESHHLINDAAIERMQDGVMLINTSRGALVDTRAVIRGLKSGRIGSLGLDVYEEEGDLFFRDLSDTVIQDDVFARLLTFPNVIITGHQAFFTEEAVNRIAETTIENLEGYARNGSPPKENIVMCGEHIAPEAEAAKGK
ncbi:MAG: 2-hydroxyacid dehydrogenase [Planctomycetota bacterium]